LEFVFERGRSVARSKDEIRLGLYMFTSHNDSILTGSLNCFNSNAPQNSKKIPCFKIPAP
jgi:hypothetical protein